jgi:hypothetical protein
MADATQELMLRVRGDNSGADKAIAGTKTAIEGLKVSGEKASGAFKNFSRSLAEARDASDVAASAANSLSNIVGKSLMGAFAVGGVKVFTDQINRMGESVKAVATEAQQAFDNIEKAGQAMSLSEATSQVSQLDALLASTGKRLSELDRSPFQNFIAGATGARVAMEELVGTSQKLRDMKLAEGMATENANAEFTAGLDEQALQIAKVNAEYEKRSRIAQTFTDKEAYRIYQEASAAQKVRETNAIIDKMAEKAAQENEKNTQEKIKLDQQFSEQSQKNIEQQIKAEKELAEAQQKRFNDLYDAEIKAQEATQKRIDANNKAEEEMAAKAASLAGDVATAKEEQQRMVGGGASDIARAGTGGSGSTGGRETSFERGMRQSAEREFRAGQRAAADAQKQRLADEVNKELAAKGESRRVGPQSSEVQNRLKKASDESARAQGRASMGTDQLAENVDSSVKALNDFNDAQASAGKSSESFSSNLSEMGTGFDEAINNANNFSDSMTENAGNMVDDFLKGGDSASKLGDSLDNAAESAKNMSEELKKSGPAGGKSGGGGGGADGQGKGSLSSIETLLQKNFDELKAYAHAT